MSLIVEFSITPLDKGESVGAYVARAVEIIDQSGLEYRLGPMGTCIEGEWGTVMAVITKCFEAMRQDSRRISISIKADYREGKEKRLAGKVESVKRKLGRNIKT